MPFVHSTSQSEAEHYPAEARPTTQSDYGRYPLHDRSQRPLHVIVAGAGPSGIALAIELKKLPHVTFEVFEKNSDVGGTWLENRYPGAACDVASHAYQYTFRPKKDWSRHFAPAEEIGAYFIQVAQEYDIYSNITLQTKVDEAIWDEVQAQWYIHVSHTSGQSEKMVKADIFVNAGGILNSWKWPDIDGLAKFQGDLIHTANWDSSFDWTNKSIAVIGSGATSIQVVPQMQSAAKKIEVFVRSPTYILPTVGFGIESSSYNEPYTNLDKQKFQQDPQYYKDFRKRIEQQMNENFSSSVKGSQEQADARQWAENLMRQSIISIDLQQKLIPKWELGCRRLTPGLPYLQAVQQANIHIERRPISCVTEEGIKTEDGEVHAFDAIICATGFDTSFLARYDIIGRNGVNLRTLWKKSVPEAYLGLAVAGFPNYFALLGPNCPIANGSLVPCIEYSVKYVIQAIMKMQDDQIKSLDVEKSKQDAYNRYIDSVHEDLVWSGSCNSWYKERSSGKVVAVWPGSSVHYMEMIEKPRWEDYNLEYTNKNPFMFMGNGVSQREATKADLAFYLDNMSQ